MFVFSLLLFSFLHVISRWEKSNLELDIILYEGEITSFFFSNREVFGDHYSNTFLSNEIGQRFLVIQ